MIRVLIADSNPPSREQLRSNLATDEDIEIVSMARDGQEALQQAHQFQPDIALLAADLAVQDGYRTAEYLAGVGYLRTQSIIIADSSSEDSFRKALRAGAKDHLTRPIERARLIAAVKEVYNEEQQRHSPAFAQAADPQRTAKILAVTGAKGGIGKTTFCANLAVALAQETGEPTCLIDLYVQYGDVGMLLNMAPKRTMAELASLDPAEVDEQLVADCLQQHECARRPGRHQRPVYRKRPGPSEAALPVRHHRCSSDSAHDDSVRAGPCDSCFDRREPLRPDDDQRYAAASGHHSGTLRRAGEDTRRSQSRDPAEPPAARRNRADARASHQGSGSQ
jgi:pilus assembly protein CpaE